MMQGNIRHQVILIINHDATDDAYDNDGCGGGGDGEDDEKEGTKEKMAQVLGDDDDDGDGDDEEDGNMSTEDGVYYQCDDNQKLWKSIVYNITMQHNYCYMCKESCAFKLM